MLCLQVVHLRCSTPGIHSVSLSVDGKGNRTRQMNFIDTINCYDWYLWIIDQPPHSSVDSNNTQNDTRNDTSRNTTSIIVSLLIIQYYSGALCKRMSLSRYADSDCMYSKHLYVGESCAWKLLCQCCR